MEDLSPDAGKKKKKILIRKAKSHNPNNEKLFNSIKSAINTAAMELPIKESRAALRPTCRMRSTNNKALLKKRFSSQLLG